MKKYLAIWAIVLIVCIASVVAFSACNIELKDMDGNEYYASSERKRSVELVNEFFEETLKNLDFVVTCTKGDGELQYTEMVKGADSYTLYKDGSQAYAFKKGGYYYTAFISEQTDGEGVEERRTYYCSDSTKKGYYESETKEMEEMYKKYHCSFMNNISGAGIVSELSEEGATFHCLTSVERISGYATSSLDFTYNSTKTTVTISASAEENKVKSVQVVTNDAEGGQSSDLTWTFSYGGASFTLPDVDSWE